MVYDGSSLSLDVVPDLVYPADGSAPTPPNPTAKTSVSGALATPSSPLMIGGDGNGNGFNGYIDEVRVYGNPLLPIQVPVIKDETHFCPVPACPNGPDHLEISSSAGGSGVTCAPTTLTITACANADCSEKYTDGVSGTLSASGTPTVNWSGRGFPRIPSGSSMVTKEVQVTTPGR